VAVLYLQGVAERNQVSVQIVSNDVPCDHSELLLTDFACKSGIAHKMRTEISVIPSLASTHIAFLFSIDNVARAARSLQLLSV
jgi:hypothetical protein